MKKLNKKGFTLIELLAVIVIMGILMFVAIPAVSRTIENSRKDTFIDNAKAYANQVKNLWSSDGLECKTGVPSTGYITSTALANGDYWVPIDSSNPGNTMSVDVTDGAGTTTTQTLEVPLLLEQGGKSSWSNRGVKGYVRVRVETDDKGNSDPSDDVIVTKFYVAMSDGIHGINPTYVTASSIPSGTPTSDELKRSNVLVSGQVYTPFISIDEGIYNKTCREVA